MIDGTKGIATTAALALVRALPYIVDGVTTEGRPHHDYVGRRYFADNARIIFVNGVGSREHDCREKAEEISRIFDGCRVDYVYVPLTYNMAKDALTAHAQPDGTALLLHTLLECDAELESLRAVPPDQRAHRIFEYGERIICILHSGGGATFESIRDRIPDVF